MSELQFLPHPETCFPVRGEYFWTPISKRTVWDDDFVRTQDNR
jgi:hypothetical protein